MATISDYKSLQKLYVILMLLTILIVGLVLFAGLKTWIYQDAQSPEYRLGRVLLR